ncbi:FtsX-like permease family protein [Tissierella sp.]|uniref:ABC transporter permease n=1 Tax=Tissierella sp. TaxID=41274 RepID=UPI0028ACFE96|nr:FtsX-like permease family protein [Tissierella sp.]
MSILKLAYLNVVRRKSQSLLTGIIASITILSFVLVFSIFFIVQDGLILTSERLGADIIVIPNKADLDFSETLFTGAEQNIYMPKDIENKIKVIEGIEKTTPQFFTATIENSSCCSYGETLRIVGIDHNSDFILKPWFEEYNLSPLKDDEVIIGSDIQVILGNKVSILGDIFKVVGTLYTTGGSMDNTIFMNIDKSRLLAKDKYPTDLWKMDNPEDLISSILIKTSSKKTDMENIVNKINNLNLGIKAVSISSSITNIKQQLDSISKIILSLWLVLLSVSSLALIGRFTSLAEGRKKETGFLRAMGMKKKEIFKLIILESWIIAGIAGIIGSTFGAILVKPLLSMISKSIIIPQGHWSLSLSIIAIIIGIVSALLLGFLASIYPAWKNSNLEPQEAIAKGDVR